VKAVRGCSSLLRWEDDDVKDDSTYEEVNRDTTGEAGEMNL